MTSPKHFKIEQTLHLFENWSHRERLEPFANGKLLYPFKRPWRDGTTHNIRFCSIHQLPSSRMAAYWPEAA
jgi:hypothetical protein